MKSPGRKRFETLVKDVLGPRLIDVGFERPTKVVSGFEFAQTGDGVERRLAIGGERWASFPSYPFGVDHACVAVNGIFQVFRLKAKLRYDFGAASEAKTLVQRNVASAMQLPEHAPSAAEMADTVLRDLEPAFLLPTSDALTLGGALAVANEPVATLFCCLSLDRLAEAKSVWMGMDQGTRTEAQNLPWSQQYNLKERIQ